MLSRLSSLSKGPETRKQLGNEFAQHWVLGSPGARALVTGPGGGEGIQQGDGAAELAVGSGDPRAAVPTILALFLVWYGSLFTSAAPGACSKLGGTSCMFL